jgi:hypothetical protein
MSDLFNRVTQDQDIVKKLMSKIPGFQGYIDRNNRRAADKMLREALANKFSEQYQRISTLQKDSIKAGDIENVDDLEEAAIKLRRFIDSVRTAAYGYAGFFDAIKINSDELATVYQYDLALLNSVDELTHAIDNVEASIGSDGLPAAIRNLRTVAQSAVDAFNKRSEIMIGGIDGGAPVPPSVPPVPPTPPAL